jgi:hypothetical protein
MSNAVPAPSRNFCAPGLVAAMFEQVPPTEIASIAPNAMWQPDSMPRVRILLTGIAALASPSLTAFWYIAGGGISGAGAAAAAASAGFAAFW